MRRRSDEDEEGDAEHGAQKRFTQNTYSSGSPFGKGTYNCVHVVTTRDGVTEVLRIGVISKRNDTTKKNLLRGLAMVSALNNVPSVLGPALVRETAEFDVLEAAQLRRSARYAEVKMCEMVADALKTDDHIFALQYLEYLHQDRSAPTGKVSVSNLMDVYVLLWFVVNGLMRYRLSHGDLKVDNIVYRAYDPPIDLVFQIDGDVYHYRTSLVPVIVDFDFATSIDTVDPDARVRVSSPYCAPPDASMITLRRLLGAPLDMDQHMETRDSYDIWTLGIVLLEKSYGRPMTDWMGDFASAHTRAYVNRLAKSPYGARIAKDGSFKGVIHRLVRGYVAMYFVAGVLDGSLGEVPFGLNVEFLYDKTLPSDFPRIFAMDDINAGVATPDCTGLFKFVSELDVSTRALLRSMLSYEPMIRLRSGIPHLYLRDPAFESFRQQTAPPSRHRYSCKTTLPNEPVEGLSTKTAARRFLLAQLP